MGIRAILLTLATTASTLGLCFAASGNDRQGNSETPALRAAVHAASGPTAFVQVAHTCCPSHALPHAVAAPMLPAPMFSSPWAAVGQPVPAPFPVPTPPVALPPGTLGQTYMRPSHPIPWDKHPRIGMLDITIADETQEFLAKQYPGTELKITVSDIQRFFEPLEGYLGTDGIWHFESEPLYPGIPHIHDAKFEVVRKTKKQEVKYGRRIEYEVETKIDDLGFRRFRLIPGRIVNFTF